MQKRIKVRGSTTSLESGTTEFVVHKMDMNTVHFKPPDDHEAQIQRQDLVENARNLKKISWQNRLKL